MFCRFWPNRISWRAVANPPSSWPAASFPSRLFRVGRQAVRVAVTIQFKPYGVKLDFTGTIEDSDVIRLKIAPEVSTLDYTNAVTISGFEIPGHFHAAGGNRDRTAQRAKLWHRRPDGQTRDGQRSSKMPGIGDIPILGQLFRSKSLIEPTLSCWFW